MKKNLLLLAFSIVLLAACSGNKKPATETAAADALLQAPAQAPVIDLTKRSHKISLDSASLLVSNILNIPALNKVVSSYALGGTFPVKSFRVLPENSGIILWSCVTEGKNPELFLALEQLKSYDTARLPKSPASQSLMRPQFLFKNAMTAPYTAASARKFIEGHTITKNGELPITNGEVVNGMDGFNLLMGTMPERYNKYPFSYFRESEDGTFKQFLDQAGENGFVRYYFGFNETEKVNLIRVILVAVDAAGKNITSINGGEALILQRSWPPPPNQ